MRARYRKAIPGYRTPTGSSPAEKPRRTTPDLIVARLRQQQRWWESYWERLRLAEDVVRGMSWQR